MKDKYKYAFLDMACRFGQTSTAEKLKVGCLLVKDGGIISEGVNGQPPSWHTEVCEDEYGNTLPTVRHSEISALEKLWNKHETAKGAEAYISHSPCLNCSIKLFTAGIKRVYYKHEYRSRDGLDYLINNGVEVEKLE